MFEVNLRRYRQSLAAIAGCDTAAFDSHQLTIVERPQSHERFTLFVITLGTGTVLSVDPGYLDFVRSVGPDTHYRAFYPPAVVLPLLEEAKRRGEELSWRGPNLGFIPGEVSDAQPHSDLRQLRVDRAWRKRYLDSATFDNALGEPNDSYADANWLWGIALVDPHDEPVAVAGAYHDGDGLCEVGVDVARDHRGRGLGATVVGAISREMIGHENVPTYYCAPTNVRSHRTALRCGFVPVSSAIRVGPPHP